MSPNHSHSHSHAHSPLSSPSRPRETLSWDALHQLPTLEASTILHGVGRAFYIWDAKHLLKLGADKGEADMTRLAHFILGDVVPRLDKLFSIQDCPGSEGIIITHQRGKPLSELWPGLRSDQRAVVKQSIVNLLVNMRKPLSHLHDHYQRRVDYFGRPGDQPYMAPVGLSLHRRHHFCRDRSEWDASRIHALRGNTDESEIDERQVQQLEDVQMKTAVGNPLVERPVLTHGDLSDRNILVDPQTHHVTGLIDWEMGNVAPAYFEYASVCLGNHDSQWKTELQDILRQVLLIECKSDTSKHKRVLDAWTKLVQVERPARGIPKA